MDLIRKVKNAVMYLNEPQLVADFQGLCKIDITGKDSGLSTADDASSTSESSEEGNSDSGCNQEMHHVKNKDHLSNGSTMQQGNGKCSKSKNGKTLRNRKLEFLPKDKEVTLTSEVSANIQKNIRNYSMENNVSFKIRGSFLYYLFCLGTALGNEAFYCYFFPYWYWNVDGYVCRRVVIVWALNMYIGQLSKDVIRWPRPSSPPVAKLEQRYELEYGMPSTHSMVGFAIPFSMLILTMERYVYSWPVGIIGCIMWCSVVSFSRAYLGMHSFLDIICGILFALILTPLIFLFLDQIDDFQLTHPYAPIIMFFVCLAMAACYPTLDKWSTARGDTTLILGVAAGISFAAWLSYQHGLYHRPTELPPYAVKIPDMEFILSTIIRMALGGTILMATRATMKFILLRTLCFFYGLTYDDPNARKCLKVELPYKYLTYFVVAFNVAYTAPLVFRCIGIERVTFFTDL